MEITESAKKFGLAALAVFKRYGVRKTTMEEIAKEAGVSKPTLYATFRNKDAALAGAIRVAKSASLAALKEAWSSTEDLDSKLDLYFERVVVSGFDVLHAAPDPDAFDTAIGDASTQAIKDMRHLEAEVLASALDDCAGLQSRGTSAEAQAIFVVDAANQAKRLSPSRDALIGFLQQLKLATLALCETRDAS